MGSQETANKRTIRRMIHEKGIQSCQLCMGMTELAPGNVWNSMPPHVHDRRVEVYMYFDLADDAVLFHMMGEPDETRHIVMKMNRLSFHLHGPYIVVPLLATTHLFGQWLERIIHMKIWIPFLFQI